MKGLTRRQDPILQHFTPDTLYSLQEDLIEDKILELQDLAAESAKLKEKIEALKGRVSMLETEVEQNPRLSDDVKRRTEQLNRTCTDRMNQVRCVKRCSADSGLLCYHCRCNPCRMR